MKIALIFPRYRYPSGDPPLGVAYLSSYIRENSNHKIEIIDTTFDKSELFLISKIKKGNYDLFGIYSNVVVYRDALRVAKILKTFNPGTPIILGGPYATVMPEDVLKDRNVDAVAIAEGEITLLQLLKNNLNFKGVKGIWYKKNGRIYKNSLRNSIENLDSIPFPARDLLQMNKYIKNWFQLDSFSTSLKGTHIIGSRGCSYNCTYCQPALRKIFGEKIRFRSPENIVDELEHLKKEYKMNSFIFEDDTFIINKKWVENICDEIIERDVDMLWGCNVRADLVRKQLLKKMKDAGLVKLYIGIESSNQRILDSVYNKKITIDQVKRSIRIGKELGLKIQGYFMLGAPTETIKEIKQTIRFAKGLDIDEAMFSITTPLPGTYLYKKTKSMIDREIGEFDYYKRYVFRDSPERKQLILFLKKKAYLEFYLSPKRVFRTIKTVFNPPEIHKTINKLKRF